jgi:hypothetical protein
MWTRQARTWEIPVTEPDRQWSAEHDGYTSLTPPARHRRSVRLDPEAGLVEITDTVSGGSHDVRLAFHLGPDVAAELDGDVAVLGWRRDAAGASAAARLRLPGDLRWSLHHGEVSPILGWYSPELGCRVPAFTLLGSGKVTSEAPLVTRLEFDNGVDSSPHSLTRQAVSLGAPRAARTDAPESRAETQ